MKCTKFLLAILSVFLISVQSLSVAADVAYTDKKDDVVGYGGKLISDPDIDIKEISYTKTDTELELTMIVCGRIVEDSDSVSYAFLLKMSGSNVYYIAKYTNNTCQLFKFSGASDKFNLENISKYSVPPDMGVLIVNVPKTMMEDGTFVFEATASRGNNSDSASAPLLTKTAGGFGNVALYIGIGAGIIIVITVIVMFIRFRPSSRRKKVGLEVAQQPPATGAPAPSPPLPPPPYQVPYPTQQPQYGYSYPPTEPYTNPQDVYAPYYKQESYTGQEYYPRAPAERGYVEPAPPSYQSQAEQFARCHVCGGIIPIPSTQRPITIVCPSCGAEGLIE